jgi:hypothetical protein
VRRFGDNDNDPDPGWRGVVYNIMVLTIWLWLPLLVCVIALVISSSDLGGPRLFEEMP